MESHNNPLHNKLRQEFGFFGGISLIFGIMATLLFYKAAIGLNSFIFTILTVILLFLISKKLNIPITKGVIFNFLGAILLGLSNLLSSSHDLQFLNNIGILLLLDASLIQLFNKRKTFNFLNELLSIIKLPFKALASLGMFFVDGNSFVKKRKIIRNDRLRNILIGCIISIPLLIITTLFLSSADLLFSKITGNIFKWILYRDFYIIIIAIVLGTLFCYSLLCGASKENTAIKEKIDKASPTIGITISTFLLILYILFCGIQILYLFAGGIFVLPAEFTYAEYARQGFFELLAVTCINIILILICENVFEENKFLRIILTAITASSYIMIASATYRMILYIRAYHLTFLRLFVLLFLLIDALILAGVIISLYNKSFPLFRYSIIVITLCYLILSFSRPDYHIAKYFLNHTDKIESEDLYFLTRYLSYDAAPVVMPLLESQYDYNIGSDTYQYYHRLISNTNARGFRDYNYSYDRAIKLIKEEAIP